ENGKLHLSSDSKKKKNAQTPKKSEAKKSAESADTKVEAKDVAKVKVEPTPATTKATEKTPVEPVKDTEATATEPSSEAEVKSTPVPTPAAEASSDQETTDKG
ncbi:hypothetical protein OAB00_02815, partial [Akkermansiaceae bacterium]|nr:hypothetical protein [Akkermansiaceae bacterium]